MAKEIRLEAVTRNEEEAGSAAARRLRGAGWLPCMVNLADGHAVNLKVNCHAFTQELHHHRSEALLMNLSIDGADTVKVLLKDVQHHPLTEALIHADFQEISMKDKMRIEVPIRLEGEAKGEAMGGVLEHLLDHVEIECLPGNLVEDLVADVSGMVIGDILYVKDLELGKGVEVLTDADVAIAAVSAPRLEEKDEESAEGGAEPELVNKEKKSEDKE